MQLFSWAIFTWTDPESSPALERRRTHHPGNSPSRCVFLVCVSADTHWLCLSPLGPLLILHFCSLVFEEDAVLPVRWVKVELVVSCSGLPLQTELTGGSDRTWGRQWDTLLKNLISWQQTDSNSVSTTLTTDLWIRLRFSSIFLLATWVRKWMYSGSTRSFPSWLRGTSRPWVLRTAYRNKDWVDVLISVCRSNMQKGWAFQRGLMLHLLLQKCHHFLWEKTEKYLVASLPSWFSPSCRQWVPSSESRSWWPQNAGENKCIFQLHSNKFQCPLYLKAVTLSAL